MLGMLNITQCVVLTVQDFFSLSPSLKIFFFLNHKTLPFFSPSQTSRANTEIISRDVLQILLLPQSVSFPSNPKVSEVFVLFYREYVNYVSYK